MGNCLQNCKLSPKESLRTATADTVPAVQPPHGWCKVIDAYDADTCRCAFQTPEGMVWFTVRLVGLDAPERRPKKGILHDLEKKAAMRARAKLLTLVCDEGCVSLTFSEPSAKGVCAKSRKLVRLESQGFDKYGRVLGTLHDGNVSINRALVDGQWASPTTGQRGESGPRKNWPPCSWPSKAVKGKVRQSIAGSQAYLGTAPPSFFPWFNLLFFVALEKNERLARPYFG